MKASGKQQRAKFGLVLACVLGFCSTVSGVEFAGGTGTPDDPYQIATAQQLIAMGRDPNLCDKHFVLVNDIDLDPNLPGGEVFDRAVIAADVNEVAPGFQGPPFTGSLVGGKHRIANLTISDADGDYVGLFRKLGCGSKVSALELVDVRIETSYRRSRYLGALSGYAEGSRIEGCSVSGRLTSVYSYLGGLIGYGTETELIDCHTDCVIDGLGGSYLGGLVGCHADGSLEDCSSSATITTDGTGSDYIGGLVGRNQGGPLTRCFHAGSISTDNTGSRYIGGVVGWNQGGLLSQCSYAGSIATDNTSARYIGGVVGRCDGGAVTACHSTGSFDARATGVGPMGGLVGGLVGGTVEMCYSTGSVKGSGTGVRRIGGLVGLNVDGAIARSYALNSIVTTGTSADDIGGLVGRCDGGTIEACYAICSLDQRRGLAGGGLVGRISRGEVRFCYAAPTFPVGSFEAGGLVGVNEGVVVHCLWDTEASGVFRSGGGLGLTTNQMMDAAYYAWNGWAGCADWVIDQGRDYPRLAWEGTAGQLVPEPELDWLEGQGTVEEPYLISTGDEFEALGLVSVVWDRQYVLVSDVNLAGVTLRPIGVRGGMGFKGVFDGDGHIIRHLSIDPEGDQDEYYGFFGCVDDGGVVCGLGLEEVSLVGGGTVVTLGPLAAENKGTIHDCYVTGTITTGGCDVDCLSGFVAVNTGTISDCYAQTSIVSDCSRGVLGGFVGRHLGGAITSCYAAGPIEYPVDERISVGGLVGLNNGTVVWSFWDTEASSCQVSAGGMGLTTSEIQDAEVLALNGWAADESWRLASGEAYPHLAWQEKPGQSIPMPATDWVSGEGTADDPYRIVDPGQLTRLSTSGVLWDKCFRLESDLDLEGATWRYIGLDGDWGFCGVFDGAGHVISGLSMTAPGGPQTYVGLFGVVAPEGVVRDVILEEVAVRVARGSWHVGLLAGWNDGVIAGCQVSGTVTVESDPDAWWVSVSTGDIGGLVGGNAGYLVGCDSGVSLEGDRNVRDLGGLVGINRGAIDDCRAAGDIDVGVDAARVGGLVGPNEEGSVRRCLADVSINVGRGGEDVGGLVGINSGLLWGCGSRGPLMIGDYARDTGGLVGTSFGGRIDSCDASSPVIAGTWGRDIGGLVGRHTGGLTSNCSARGSVDVGDDAYEVGALAGINTVAIAQSYATGPISHGAGAERIGGLSGHESGTIRSSYDFSADAGEPNVTPEMFSDWDFYGEDEDGTRDVWFAIEGGLPVLSWQAEESGLVSLPDLYGLSLEQARGVLSSLGFTSGDVHVDYHEVCPPDTVVYVRPSDLVAAGSRVDIVVSAGPYDWADNEGTGTEADPYQIAGAGQLASLGVHPELWSCCFELTADIDLSGVLFDRAVIAGDVNEAVGVSEVCGFEGRFDGQGRAIWGLTIDAWHAPHGGLGLFGAIGPQGEVANLEIVDAGILAGGSSTDVGLVAGSSAGVVHDCRTSGVIIGGLDSSRLGGLVGANLEGTIAGCSADALAVAGGGFVGGIAGDDTGTLTECSASGVLVENERVYEAGERLTGAPARYEDED